MFHAFRLLFYDMESLQGRSRCGRRVTCRENVSAAGVAQIIDGVFVTGNETADGGKALREGSHDEVYLIGQSEVVAYASSLTAEDTESVCLIHHDRTVVLMLQLDNCRQIGQVAFHGEHAVNDNQLDSFLRQFLEHTLQIFHVIMFIVKLGGEAQTAAIYDACMVAVVTDDIIATPDDHGENTGVH